MFKSVGRDVAEAFRDSMVTEESIARIGVMLRDVLANVKVDVAVPPEIRAAAESMSNGVDVNHKFSIGDFDLGKIFAFVAENWVPLAGIPGIIILVCLIRSNRYVSALGAGVVLARPIFELCVPTDVKNFVRDEFNKLLEMLGVLDAQALDESHVSHVSRFIALASTVVMTRQRPDEKLLSHVIRSMRDVPRTSDGVEWVVKETIVMFETCVNAILSYFGHDQVVLMKSNIEELNIWMEDVKRFVSLYDSGDLPINVVNADNLFRMIRRGDDLCSKQGGNPKIASRVVQFRAELSRLRSVFAASNYRNAGFRVRPLSVFLSGPSGCGKSVASVLFAKDLSARTIPPELFDQFMENPDSFVYSRQQENVYWNGYSNQWVTIFDDILQMKDSEVNMDNEIMGIIRNSQDFPANLHMADMASKANTFFRSRVLLATTNIREFNHNVIKSIHTPEAFRRRIDYNFVCVPKAELCLQSSLGQDVWRRKYDPALRPVELDVNAWEFHLKGRVYSYQQMLDKCVQKFEEIAHGANLFGEKVRSSYARIISERKRETMFEEIPLDAQCDNEDEPCDVAKSKAVTVDGVTYFGPCDEVPRLEKVFCQERIDELCMEKLGYSWSALKPWLKEKYTYLDVFEPCAVKVQMFRALSDNDWNDLCTVRKCMGLFTSLAHVAKTVREAIEEEVESFQRQNLFAKLMKVGSAILSFCKYVLLGVGLYQTFKLLFGSKEEDKLVPQSAYSMRRQGAKVAPLKPKAVHSVVESQIYDPNVEPIAISIRQNCFYVRHEERTRIMVVALAGHTYMCPQHMIETLKTKESDEVYEFINVVNGAYSFKLTVAEILKNYVILGDGMKDLALFVIPTNICGARSSILSKIVTERDLAAEREWYISFHNMRYEEDTVIYSGNCKPYKKINVRNEGEVYTVVDVLAHNVATRRGDCGNPIFLHDKASQARKFCAIHVAGNELGNAVATIFNREMIDKGMEELKKVTLVTTEEDNNLTPVEVFVAEGGFVSLGRLPNGHRIKSSGKSRIEKSELHGSWGESEYLPAVLGPVVVEGKKIDPLREALKHYGTPLLKLDDRRIRLAMEHLRRTIMRETKESKYRDVIDFETAVRGIPGVRFMDGINRKSSAGYPWSIGGNGKKHIFGDGEDYDFTTPEAIALKSSVMDIIDKARKGVRKLHIFTDFLKDERRKKDKVKNGQTRFVSGAPLDYVIASRMYNMGFNKALMDACITSGSCIGINPFDDYGWSMLARLLESKGYKIIAGDIKKLDASQMPQIQSAIRDLIDAYYKSGGEDYLIRYILYLEVLASRHAMGDIVYEWPHGLPSGINLTTIINTLYVLLILRLVYMDVFGEESLDSFEEFVSAFVYGDDSVTNIADNIAEWFNQHTISKESLKYGITITSEVKCDLPPPHRALKDVGFLKRSFVKWPKYNRVVAPLDLEVILEMPYWRHTSSAPQTQTMTIVETALMELSLHGQAVFEKWFDKIATSCVRNLGLHPRSSCWESYLDIAFASDGWY